MNVRNFPVPVAVIDVSAPLKNADSKNSTINPTIISGMLEYPQNFPRNFVLLLPHGRLPFVSVMVISQQVKE